MAYVAGASACGSMVLDDYDLIVFALAERKNDKIKKVKYRAAEGYSGFSDAIA